MSVGWEGLEGDEARHERPGGRQRLNTLPNVRRLKTRQRKSDTQGHPPMNPILRDRKANKLHRRQGGGLSDMVWENLDKTPIARGANMREDPKRLKKIRKESELARWLQPREPLVGWHSVFKAWNQFWEPTSLEQ